MKTAIRTLRMPVLAATLAVLAGCGFQLRGAAPVSDALQPLAVECAEAIPSDLCIAVTEQLRLGEIELVEPGQAAYRLRLRKFEQSRRASAITLQAAAAEFTLRQTVTMDVITANQMPLIAETDLNSSETFRYDEANVLAKQREEQALRELLYQRLAQQVIFRLAPLTQARIDAIREAAEASESRDPQ